MLVQNVLSPQQILAEEKNRSQILNKGIRFQKVHMHLYVSGRIDMSRPPIQNVLELIHTHIRDEVHTQFEKLKKEKKQEMANWISNSQIK